MTDSANLADERWKTREEAHLFVLPSEAVGALAAQHLIARGHRHLALVQPDGDVMSCPFAQHLDGMCSVIHTSS
ncbi:hypothetical protein [Ktedonobacter racemifer]|uniref:hypothetical protein n=1 Tax=Ktedonobacter racemifer TaxID=363277 RepID=UPI001B7F91CA|nr:hypothetical protein [Ktedonobacter racemifer]